MADNGRDHIEAPFVLEMILRRYGNRRPAIQAVYERMYDEAGKLVESRSVQRTFPATRLPTLAACLPGAETISLGLCTIGPALDNHVSALFNEDPVSAVVLDEIGTRWINGLAREMHLGIRETARAEGKRASPSYRPGIGRWPVELQSQLFRHLPAAEIGVELSKEMMMVPQKSISMIVAVGTKLGRNCYAPGGNR